MNVFFMVNVLLFLVVIVYVVYLFVYLIRMRIVYIKFGQREEFDKCLKECLQKIWVNVFGQKKLLKDKKSGIIYVLFFYGFIFVQFGVIDFILKGLFFDWYLLFGLFYLVFIFFQEIVMFFILVVVVWVFYWCYIEKFVRLK